MKSFVFTTLCFFALGLCAQEAYTYKDAEFQTAYKQIALQPGHDNKAVIRKWDSDIKIFTEDGMDSTMKEQLQKVIDIANPVLGKIKIMWVTNKDVANLIIKFDTIQRNNYSVHWDLTNTIYKGTIFINKVEVFNVEERNNKAQQFLLKLLGYFTFKEVDKKDSKFLKSKLASWRQGISPFDLEVIKVHYSDGIHAGMSEKELDAYFKKAKN